MPVVGPFLASDHSTPCRPSVIHAYRRHAPRKAPCPHCGQRAPRKGFHTRTVRSIAYQRILLLHVTTGEYRARCQCCATFSTLIAGIEPKARYDNRVRQAVLDRLLEDRMSLQQLQQALHRDFCLDLSEGFLYDCLDWQVRRYDGAAYRQWAVANFSGTLCLDEIHLGHHALLLATDPLRDFPVGFALVSANDEAHMGRFLRQLQAHGLTPRVVVTDGSSLYPQLLGEIWPQATHQLCIFHVLQDINQAVLQAVRRIRMRLQRQARRKPARKRRRTRQGTFLPRSRAEWTVKQKAHFVYQNRFLIVKRRSRFTLRQKQALIRVLEYAPNLRVLRQFMDEVHGLFERGQTEATAWRRWQRLQGQAAYAAVPELAVVLRSLTAVQFGKMIAFLRSPVGRRVRTNNHVERMNRKLRLYEKSRYKWRQGRTKVRFVCLLIDRGWGTAAREGRTGSGGGKGHGAVPRTWARVGRGQRTLAQQPLAA